MRECSECGKEFKPQHKLSLTCSPECSRTRRLRVAREWKQAAYWANPQKFIDRVVRANQRQCTKCGRVLTSIYPKEGFVCYKCRRDDPVHPCMLCGKDVTVKRKMCDDCYCEVKFMAIKLGITREYLSKLMRPYRQQGFSRKDALQQVYKDRTYGLH